MSDGYLLNGWEDIVAKNVFIKIFCNTLNRRRLFLFSKKKEYIFMIIQFKSISLASKMNILLINLI